MSDRKVAIVAGSATGVGYPATALLRLDAVMRRVITALEVS